MDEPVVGDYMATGENCYVPTENDTLLGLSLIHIQMCIRDSRSLNATEMAVGINAALHGDERYKWFID